MNIVCEIGKILIRWDSGKGVEIMETREIESYCNITVIGFY